MIIKEFYNEVYYNTKPFDFKNDKNLKRYLGRIKCTYEYQDEEGDHLSMDKRLFSTDELSEMVEKIAAQERYFRDSVNVQNVSISIEDTDKNITIY